MKIAYLPSARDDLVWMRTYCTRVFPEGSARARVHFRSAERLLARQFPRRWARARRTREAKIEFRQPFSQDKLDERG